VSEVLDWDPGVARDALTLLLAVILGAMSERKTPPASPGRSL
jgi:hypothetical protein